MMTFDSIHETHVTFRQEGDLQAGQVCKVTSGGAVGACSAGDEFCGVARTVRLGLVGTVVQGFARLPYSGTAPALGRTALCADGKGGVKVGGETKYLVVQAENGTVSVLL